MKTLKRLTWENMTKIINSMQKNSSSKWRNDMALMILEWMFFDEILNFSANDRLFLIRNRALRTDWTWVSWHYRDLWRDLRKNMFQMNIKMVMARMLNYMASYLKKFYSFSGLVCDHFSAFLQHFYWVWIFVESRFPNQLLGLANILTHRTSLNWTTKLIFIK